MVIGGMIRGSGFFTLVRIPDDYATIISLIVVFLKSPVPLSLLVEYARAFTTSPLLVKVQPFPTPLVQLIIVELPPLSVFHVIMEALAALPKPVMNIITAPAPTNFFIISLTNSNVFLVKSFYSNKSKTCARYCNLYKTGACVYISKT